MKVNSFSGKVVIFLVRTIAFSILKLLYFSLRYSIKGDPKPYPINIYIAWHQNMIPLLLSRSNENIATLISSSFDGEIIAQTSKKLGFFPIRGSSSKRGISALKEMIKYLDFNSISLTPDGPKGPKYSMKESPFFLSYLSKKPIIPTRVVVSKKWVFNSWDNFILPKPFSHVEIQYLPPVFVEDKNQIEFLANQVRSQMIN